MPVDDAWRACLTRREHKAHTFALPRHLALCNSQGGRVCDAPQAKMPESADVGPASVASENPRDEAPLNALLLITRPRPW